MAHTVQYTDAVWLSSSSHRMMHCRRQSVHHQCSGGWNTVRNLFRNIETFTHGSSISSSGTTELENFSKISFISEDMILTRRKKNSPVNEYEIRLHYSTLICKSAHLHANTNLTHCSSFPMFYRPNIGGVNNQLYYPTALLSQELVINSP